MRCRGAGSVRYVRIEVITRSGRGPMGFAADVRWTAAGLLRTRRRHRPHRC